MRMSTRVRRTLATVAAATLLVTGTLSTASAANAALSPASVTRVAALGDSITLGVLSCLNLKGCPANSWSTGTSILVGSHLLKIKAARGGAAPTGHNFAVPGARSSGLDAQAQKAVQAQAQYVTIEIGANDACAKTVSAMTPRDTFKSNVMTALTTLSQSASAPQIFVASIPSLQRLYDVNKDKVVARLSWGLLKTCQSMLANPASTKPDDVARRAAVQQRVNEYNAALAEACQATANCRYDGGVVAGYAFSAADISHVDFFHPSLIGQVTLARITWPATQWAS